MLDDSLTIKFLKALEVARFAPSVHNTQPWIINIVDGAVSIVLDQCHVLRDGDPTGREGILSLGIFAEAVILAARDEGIEINHLDFSQNTVHFDIKHAKRKTGREYSRLLEERCSDRSIYKPVTLSKQQVSLIAQSASDLSQAHIWVRTDRAIIDKLASFTSKAIGMALSTPSFRDELAKHLIMPWSSNRRGIAIASLHLPQPFVTIKLFLLRFGIGINAESNLELRRWRSASAVIVITARGDMPQYWFEAGRAYLRAALAVQRVGLSQATSAAIVEASNYHEDIEQMLGTTQRIQAVIRVGSGSSRRFYSPRVRLEDILHRAERSA